MLSFQPTNRQKLLKMSCHEKKAFYFFKMLYYLAYCFYLPLAMLGPLITSKQFKVSYQRKILFLQNHGKHNKILTLDMNKNIEFFSSLKSSKMGFATKKIFKENIIGLSVLRIMYFLYFRMD